MQIKIEDHSAIFLMEMKGKIQTALTKCGLEAERYAKVLCPVDTGNLRNSIANQVQDKTMMVGSNVHYAPYVEYGTGRHSTLGGQMTINGMQARPYLKPSIADHEGDYKQIIEDTLKA